MVVTLFDDSVEYFEDDLLKNDLLDIYDCIFFWVKPESTLCQRIFSCSAKSIP